MRTREVVAGSLRPRRFGCMVCLCTSVLVMVASASCERASDAKADAERPPVEAVDRSDCLCGSGTHEVNGRCVAELGVVCSDGTEVEGTRCVAVAVAPGAPSLSEPSTDLGDEHFRLPLLVQQAQGHAPPLSTGDAMMERFDVLPANAIEYHEARGPFASFEAFCSEDCGRDASRTRTPALVAPFEDIAIVVENTGEDDYEVAFAARTASGWFASEVVGDGGSAQEAGVTITFATTWLPPARKERSPWLIVVVEKGGGDISDSGFSHRELWQVQYTYICALSSPESGLKCVSFFTGSRERRTHYMESFTESAEAQSLTESDALLGILDDGRLTHIIPPPPTATLPDGGREPARETLLDLLF